jgi:hypothetical protein
VRYTAAATRLGNTWRILFWVGVAMVAIRVGIQLFYQGDSKPELFLKSYFNMLAMLVPVGAAYAYALLSALGFERHRDRSREMTRQLMRIRRTTTELIRRLDAGALDVAYDDVRLLAQGTVETTILSELTDWRVLVNSKAVTVL